MSDTPTAGPARPPQPAKPTSHGPVTSIEVMALIMSAIWLVAAGGFFLTLDRPDPGTEPAGGAALRFVMTMLAIFLPIAMIWVAAIAMRSSRIMREESRRLQAAIDAMRKTYLDDRKATGRLPQASVEKKLEEIAQAAQNTESAIATFATARSMVDESRPSAAIEAARVDDSQPNLGLTADPTEVPPLATDDLIRALNFPDTEEDTAGFAALRRGLSHHRVSQVIQASQDVLTLLSQDGIYMDDLRPDRARPEIWRLFAEGERGKVVSALGGVRDRSSLALSSGRMREDPIFRDAAHHFLRKFDHLLADVCEGLTDQDIVALSETRTARAFMLLGRVTGIFT